MATSISTPSKRISRWTLVDAPVESTAGDTLFEYDTFGRRSKIAAPGDTLEQPSLEFHYELHAPVSQMIVQARSEAGFGVRLH